MCWSCFDPIPVDDDQYLRTVIMEYMTYWNSRNPHVMIHVAGCKQIKKRGGEHKYAQGGYEEHATYADAKAHAKTTKLPVKECSFCKPPART